VYLPNLPSITDPVRRVCRKRPSLRIIVSSATLDATAFLEFFSSPPDPIDTIIVSLEGRAYPVQIAYLEEPTEDYVRKAAETVMSIHGQVRSTFTHSRDRPDAF
jgi:ATP-dependent RNA helicase DDX35